MSPTPHVVHTVADSPYGPLTLVATDSVLSGLYMAGQRHRPPQETFGEPDPRPFTEALRQLDAYFAGELTRFDLPLRLTGTDFQRGVWERLRAIPYGETRSYGELAEALGKPGASRAVGLANGKNPIGIVVPCHRVIGSTGSLTGYGGGLDRKRRLLAFEGAAAGASAGPATARTPEPARTPAARRTPVAAPDAATLF
ncbi:methylated-DNA--[protein]-cysteine S-methyltransferase [Streptomyces sp. NRRL F-5135]|uniref:methylated-DNA--[protein]-cysteine S-methyltransferase n=1 Tax=Streptomyces sp. NRRL F-5135 TaxID=1463858 RepID=UPI00099DC016|nr:methylated-DNA--[protein]-cysteine S-methyltransferase [Streptomyces sp. NRRL F-5135]